MDSSLLINITELFFTVNVGWDGDIYYVKATKVEGKFEKSKWVEIWKNIKALPGTTEGTPDDYRFVFPVLKKKKNKLPLSSGIYYAGILLIGKSSKPE